MSKGILVVVVTLAASLLAYGEVARAQAKHEPTVSVANLNVLNGIDCFPVRGDQCRLPERIALLLQHLVAIGCPDIVTLQEIVTREFAQITEAQCVGPLDDIVELITDGLASLNSACGFTDHPYQVVFDPAARREPADPPCVRGRGYDEELILTRYALREMDSPEVMPLYSPFAPFFFRHVLYARIDHPLGPVDVFTTHLASDGDLASSPCGINVLPAPLMSPRCPAECRAFIDTVQECQAKQTAAFVETRPTSPAPAFFTGDLNAHPHSAVYKEFTKAAPRREKRRWIDSHLAAGNPECNRHTGLGCTSGRVAIYPNGSSDLENPSLNVDERIDYIFVVPPSASELECQIQEQGTGLFADEPNPFLPKHAQCGPIPDAICWASDHNGTQAKLSCERSADHDFSRASW